MLHLISRREYLTHRMAPAIREAIYYVRAIQKASLTVNAGNLRCEFSDKGECSNVKPCYGDLRTELGDECMKPAEERAWSSPIFVRPDVG